MLEEAMNKKNMILKTLVLITMLFLFNFCEHEDDYYDDTPPSHPKNVTTYVGDTMVEITWDENKERDVAGYNVYFAYSYWGEYELIGNTNGNYFVDYEAVNGELYYLSLIHI
jgi:fibronectin type 3 domain-containing protein